MDDLVKLVSQKAGIPEDKAKMAVETVMNFLKQKLPAPLAGQVDALLAGGAGGNPADLLNSLSSMLGKK